MPCSLLTTFATHCGRVTCFINLLVNEFVVVSCCFFSLTSFAQKTIARSGNVVKFPIKFLELIIKVDNARFGFIIEF